MEDLSFLIKVLPPAILFGSFIIWLLLKYWDKLKELGEDLRCLYSWFQKKLELFCVNRAFGRSFNKTKEQPLFKGIDGTVVTLQFKEDPKSKGHLELKGRNRAIAIIPRLNVKNVLEWTRKHLNENVMPLFFMENLPELRKAMELVYLKIIIDELGFDGAYSVAFQKILKNEFKESHIEQLFTAFVRLNEELKPKPWIDKRFLRIILIEAYKMELKLGVSI